MAWDATCRCLHFWFQVSDARGIESFQILLNGDWTQCIHPNFNHAGAKRGRWEICGPDEPQHELNWTVAGPTGNRVDGKFFDVRVFLWDDESVSLLDWIEIDGPMDGAKTSE